MENKTAQQAQMLANRLQKRFRHLKKWALRSGIGVFRLYDRDIPEIPLVLDFYGDCSLPAGTENPDWALSGALYKRPYEKDADDEEQWLCVMKESVTSALGISPEHVFLKQRERQRGISQYEKVSKAHFEKIVSEGGLSFKVNLSDYLDTGLFPDRRLLRAMIRAEAGGKRVLNLFSYTGSFSVYAAAGGAVSTDSVDLSNTYLNWARENFSLNGFSAGLLPRINFLSADLRGLRTCGSTRINANKIRENIGNIGAHKLIRADVLDFIDRAVASNMRWDIIIIDPPAFSNSKKMTENFDLNRDIFGLLGKCLKLLSAGGKVFLSVNLKRSAPTAAELEAELKKQSLLQKLSLRVTDITSKITDEDFKGKKTPLGFVVELL